MNKNAIIIPFANIDNYHTGTNIDADKSISIYLKNAVVATVSSKLRGGGNNDVIFITNIDVPSEFKEQFQKFDIKIVHCEFHSFRFKTNLLWYLAFYKLCAIKYMLENYEYDNYVYMDTDVIVQHSFDSIWEECKENILLYDINHGLQVNDYRIIVDELIKYYGERKLITHYGGEFFLSNRNNGMKFINECLNVFNEMLKKDISTTKGDEYIISIAANTLKPIIKNAGAYIYRYWTGRNFRLVSTNYKYNEVAVLHMPNEKSSGILKIYDYIKKNNDLPTNNKIWKICRLNKSSLKDKIRTLLGR